MACTGPPLIRNKGRRSTNRSHGIALARCLAPATFSDPRLLGGLSDRSERPERAVLAVSAEAADLLLGHHALDILGLALDAVTRSPVGFDRQAAHNGIDAARPDHGAALRALHLMMDVVIDCVAMRHGRFFPLKQGF